MDDVFRRQYNRTSHTSIGGRNGPIGFRPGSHIPIYDDRAMERDLPTLRTDDDFFANGFMNGSFDSEPYGLHRRTQQARSQDPKDKATGPLRPEYVDMYAGWNKRNHRCAEYETDGLIVRRGQPFSVSVTFSRPYNKETDKVALILAVGKKPRPSKGTMVRVAVDGAGGAAHGHAHHAPEWECKVTNNKQNALELQVTPPPDAIIGKYELYVQATTKQKDGTNKHHRYKHPETFVVLFNAWCKDDQVFMDWEEGRKEYVLNETGRVYVGSSKKQTGRPWNFGQFEDVCLQAALLALEKSSLAKQAHGNPTRVTRALSSMANSLDREGGILTGNWSGNYSGGKSPTAWNGSVEILREYMRTKRPVCFGQCWVFSGLLTTLGRTLGIPTRSVTNFESAHDTDTSLTIDRFVTIDGKEIPGMAGDSVWNFHVWNESWFERPDLPKGYGGWQAFDATPQEASEGIMRCGPAPVKAIQSGDVFLGYDAKFIFAEVNGDRLTWVVTDEDLVPTNIDRYSVGKHISTKAVGSSMREDVTRNYKFEEGSGKEFDAMQKASAHSSKKDISHLYEAATAHDVTCFFDAECSKTGDIEIYLKASSPYERTIEVHVHCNAKYYTGIPGEELASFSDKVVLEPKKEELVTFRLNANEYMRKLDGDATVGCSCLVRVLETAQVYTAQDKVVVDLPDLEIKAPKEVRAGQKFTVQVGFHNPLPISLTSVVLYVEGPGVMKQAKFNLGRVLRPGDTINQQMDVTMRPWAEGTREIIACMTSQQLNSITGTALVKVIPK